MANPEHVEILKQGVEVWNRWREENPQIKPDLYGVALATDLKWQSLSGANLNDAELREANLERALLFRAHLREANLSRAHFGGANLNEANLIGAKLFNANLEDAEFSRAHLDKADLREAHLAHAVLFRSALRGTQLFGADCYLTSFMGSDLSGADLLGADLTSANLEGATLTGASLIETIFTNANLIDADLTGARLGDTFLLDTDLTAARGLDSCIHNGPSFIDYRTLVTSGRLPLSFLRGCGLPDALIDYLPSLLNEPIQLYSVFISYSHQDEDFAKRLHDALQGKGVRCWYAPENIQGGKKIHEQIDQAIRLHDKLLLVLSEHSMNSEWVKTEIANARQREIDENRRILFPIRLVDMEKIKAWKCFDTDVGKDSAREIREYFIPDFSNWKDYDSFEQAFSRLLRDLQADEMKGNG